MKRIVAWCRSTPPTIQANLTTAHESSSLDGRETKPGVSYTSTSCKDDALHVRIRSDLDTESAADASDVSDIIIHVDQSDIENVIDGESSEPEADASPPGRSTLERRLNRELKKLQSIVSQLNSLELDIQKDIEKEDHVVSLKMILDEHQTQENTLQHPTSFVEVEARINAISLSESGTSHDCSFSGTTVIASNHHSCITSQCSTDESVLTASNPSSPKLKRIRHKKCRHCRQKQQRKKEFRDVASGKSPVTVIEDDSRNVTINLRRSCTELNKKQEIKSPATTRIKYVASDDESGRIKVSPGRAARIKFSRSNEMEGRSKEEPYSGPFPSGVPPGASDRPPRPSGGSSGPFGGPVRTSAGPPRPDPRASGAIPKTRLPPRPQPGLFKGCKIEGPVVDEVLGVMPIKQKPPLGPPGNSPDRKKLVLVRSATPIPDARDVKRASIRRVQQENQKEKLAEVASGTNMTGGERASGVKGIWCEMCNTRLVELKRQSVKLWMPYAVQRGPSQNKDRELIRHIEERLQLPIHLQRHLQNDICTSCETSTSDLRQEALRMVHSLERTQAQLGPAIMAGNAGRKNAIPLPRTNTLYSPAHHRLVRQGLPRQRSSSPHGGAHYHSALSRAEREREREKEREKIIQERLGYTRTPSPYPKEHRTHSSKNKHHHQMLAASSPMLGGRTSTAVVGVGVEGHVSPSPYSQPSALRPTMLPLATKNNPQYSHSQTSTHHPQGYMPHPTLTGIPGVGQFGSPHSTSSTGSNASVTASFFARAAQKLNASSKKKKKSQIPPDPDPPPFPTNFCDVIRVQPPPGPPCLLRTASRQQAPGSGKVKVMLRVCPVETNNTSSWLNLDIRRKQVTVYDPSQYSGFTAPSRRQGVSAPKMFAFDAIFSQDDSLAEICSTSLVEIIQAVVNGADGCLFCYGHARLGKTYTMLGIDDSPQNLGVIPCAISWLFRLINDHKERTGARFSVRVSAVEVTGKQEKLKDLLSDVAGGTEAGGTTAPGVYLREDPICGMQIENQSELRAPTASRAAYYLDAAIAARTVPEVEEDARNSHLLITLSVYQYRVEKSQKGQNGVAGGRSRLHLIDLGSCSKSMKDVTSGNNALSLSALGNVILALLNGQRHVPHRDSKLTQLIREAFGNWSCRTCMIAHVSPSVHAYNETLQVIQLASRIHRMKRRKNKFSSTSSDDSSCDDHSVRLRTRMRPGVRMGILREDGMAFSHSDPDYSSSELSCDTVIYVGANGRALSDRELTDNEGPPASLPIDFTSRSTTANKIEEKHDASDPSSRIPKPSATNTAVRFGASSLNSKLPPRSPSRNVSSSNTQGNSGGIVQLPRKLNSKIKTQAKPVTEEGAVNGSEHWIDGPSAATYQQASAAPWGADGPRVVPPSEPWMYSSGTAPDGQYYPSMGVNPHHPVAGTQQAGEHWIDGPNSVPKSTVKDSEQWVDGPSAFRVQPSAEQSSRSSHKMWNDMPKAQAQDNSNSALQTHSSKPVAERTPKMLRKETAHHKTKSKPLEVCKPKNPIVTNVVEENSISAKSNTNSNTSLSVNADSRPVSCHSEEPETVENKVNEPELAESGEVQYPVRAFVHDWVLKHSITSLESNSKEEEQHSPRTRRSSQSPARHSHQNPHMHGHHGTVDDMALPKKTHSPDRYINSAQSSPRLRRIRKHTPPHQTLPIERTAAWVMSVQDTKAKLIPGDSPIKPPAYRQNADPECDQGIPGSPPPDYESVVAGLVDGTPSMVHVTKANTDSYSNIGKNSTLDTRTESCRDSETKPCVDNTAEATGCSSKCDNKNNGDCSLENSSSSCANDYNVNNRESIYELQMDEQLETADGTHKTSFGSDDMSAWSSGSYQNITDTKLQALTSSVCMEIKEHDEGIDDETKDIGQLSPLSVQADNESGIASGGSGGHLSPPSSSDDSEKSPGKKLVRPSSLRRPDGASNPNLTDIDPQKDCTVVEEEEIISVESPESTSKCMSECVRNPAADGQSPQISPVSLDKTPEKSPTSSSPRRIFSKLSLKSSIPSPTKPSVAPKPVPKSSNKNKAEKPGVPPRGSSRTSTPCGSASSSPSKSSGLPSPIKCSPAKTLTKERNSKLPKSASTGSNSPSQEKDSFSRSSSTKSSKSSKLPAPNSLKNRSLSSPTKSLSGSSKENKSTLRSSSKSPSPSKRDKESRLPKFTSKSSDSGHRSRHNDSDSGNDSGIVKNDKFLSPYTKLTKPRISLHSVSSGHGSDNSSSISSHLPPQAGSKIQAALNKTETSSGYESMVRDDSEATTTSSSNHDSNSEGSNGTRINKIIKKKEKPGYRSKSAPARASSESPCSSPVQSPVSVRRQPTSPVLPSSKVWVDTRHCTQESVEPLEIKKYCEEDLEKMARRRREAEFRAVEKRRQRISELLRCQEAFKLEMMEAKAMLMIDNSTWSFDLHVAQHMDRDDPCYLEALEKETSILEKRVDACKSRIMLVTCFDV